MFNLQMRCQHEDSLYLKVLVIGAWYSFQTHHEATTLQQNTTQNHLKPPPPPPPPTPIFIFSIEFFFFFFTINWNVTIFLAQKKNKNQKLLKISGK